MNDSRPNPQDPTEQTMSIEQDAQDNLKYQRWLADSLVSNLGYDKAVKACREMCWYGTLYFLMKRKDGGAPAAVSRPAPLTEAA
jgi:hypothetical protein